MRSSVSHFAQPALPGHAAVSIGQAESGERRDARAERGWRLLAVGVVVGAFALLGSFGGLGFGLSGLGDSAASVGRSLEAVVASPEPTQSRTRS